MDAREAARDAGPTIDEFEAGPHGDMVGRTVGGTVTATAEPDDPTPPLVVEFTYGHRRLRIVKVDGQEPALETQERRDALGADIWDTFSFTDVDDVMATRIPVLLVAVLDAVGWTR